MLRNCLGHVLVSALGYTRSPLGRDTGGTRWYHEASRRCSRIDCGCEGLLAELANQIDAANVGATHGLSRCRKRQRSFSPVHPRARSEWTVRSIGAVSQLPTAGDVTADSSKMQFLAARSYTAARKWTFTKLRRSMAPTQLR